MGQRTLDEYVDQERQTTGMAVNPPSLLLKGCREAQKMHGNDTAPVSPTNPVRISKTDF